MKTITNYLKMLAVFGILFSAITVKAQGCAPNFISTISGGNVTFTSTSVGINSVNTTYYWTFGNGATANGTNLIFTSTTYTANGTYTVSLFVVSTSPTCSNVVTHTINITSATTPTCNLNANFTSSQGTNGLVNFNNTTTGTVVGTTYSWNYGDASSSTNFSSPHTYTANGSYIVTLTANNNFTASCVSTKTAVVVVNSICNLVANFTYTTGSNGLVNFTSTSAGTTTFTTHHWYFGNGLSAFGANASQTYTANGTYVVTLVDSTSFPTCTSQISQTITITNITNPCNLSANFSGSGTNGVFNFNNTTTGTSAGVTYAWNFGDAGTSTNTSPSHTYANSGTYLVTLTANNNYSYSCVSTKTMNVVVNICNLVASFSSTVGANGSVNFLASSTGSTPLTGYSWNFGDGANGSGANPTHVYQNGTYNVLLTAINYSTIPQCSDTIVHTIVVASNTCVANANFSIAPTATAQYWNVIPAAPANVTGAHWTWGDGSSSNTLYTSHQYSVAGTYTLCLTVTVNCGATASYCNSYYIFKSSSNTDQSMINVNVVDPSTITGFVSPTSKNSVYTLYPNPTNGDFTINMNGVTTNNVKITMFNVIGKLVYETEAETNNGEFIKEISTNQLSNGVYFIKVNADNKDYTKKVVINK